MIGADAVEFLRCVLCEVDEALGERNHIHHHGEIPLTPCKPCWLGNHEACEPIAPYWCACTHKDCWNRML